MKFTKYKFNNKLLGNVILFRITSNVIWTQLPVNELFAALGEYFYMNILLKKDEKNGRGFI